MTDLIEEAGNYVIKERAKTGYYTDSVEVLDLVDDLVDRLKAADKNNELLLVAVTALKQVEQINDNPSTYSAVIDSIVTSATEVLSETLAKYNGKE